MCSSIKRCRLGFRVWDLLQLVLSEQALPLVHEDAGLSVPQLLAHAVQLRLQLAELSLHCV